MTPLFPALATPTPTRRSRPAMLPPVPEPVVVAPPPAAMKAIEAHASINRADPLLAVVQAHPIARRLVAVLHGRIEAVEPAT